MTNNQFYFWIGQHENGRYSKGHAHTSAAILICLKGKGYTYQLAGTLRRDAVEGWPRRPRSAASTTSPSAWSRRRRAARAGITSTSAPEGAAAPHRVVRSPQSRTRSRRARRRSTDYTAIDVNQGGTAIPYWMEDPFMRDEYEACSQGASKTGWTRWYEQPANIKSRRTTSSPWRTMLPAEPRGRRSRARR